MDVVRYENAFMYYYDVREVTPVAAMERRVPLEVKKARLKQVIDRQLKITAQVMAERVVSSERMLVEGTSRDDHSEMLGRTSRDERVAFKGDAMDVYYDPIVRGFYDSNENIRVLDTHCAEHTPKRCLIFFSGHGLYHPNTEERFRQVVIEKDRYEWEQTAYSQRVQCVCDRVIFVRDVLLSWYVEGVNARLHNIELAAARLKELTAGYDVETCGNSAGGYAAVVFGCLLGAKRIYSVSGQFVLIETTPLLEKHKDDPQYSRYYDTRALLENYRGEVIYAYPCLYELDIAQAKFVQGIKAVRAMKVRSAVHGTGLSTENYRRLFFRRHIHTIGGGGGGLPQEVYLLITTSPIEFIYHIQKNIRAKLHIRGRLKQLARRIFYTSNR